MDSLRRGLAIGRVALLSAAMRMRRCFAGRRRGAAVDLGEIDLVYLWSDPADPEWAARRARVLAGEGSADGFCQINLLGAVAPPALDELRYSLRSVAAHLRGFRDIYLVVDGQRPAWLDADHPQVKLIEVGDLITSPDHFPSFNTQAIESHFHLIPGLSERFVYFNDDFFLKAPVSVADHFTPDGFPRVRLGRALARTGTPGMGDEGDTAGQMNAGKLLDAVYGERARPTVMHRPYAHRKDMFTYVEGTFPEAVEATRASRFRSPQMCALHSFLIPYVASHRGRAELLPPRLLEKDMFHWPADAAGAEAMAGRIRGSRGSAFCVQEARGREMGADAVAAFHDFMTSLYPEPSPFEKAEPDSTR